MFGAGTTSTKNLFGCQGCGTGTTTTGGGGCTLDGISALLDKKVTQPISSMLFQIMMIINPPRRHKGLDIIIGMEATTAVETTMKPEYVEYLRQFGEPPDWQFDPVILEQIRRLL